ncbi:MAG: type IV pilus twitching motility protein PilT [Candidatus Bipolaricaulia bacterium]
MINAEEIMVEAYKRGASDIYITAGMLPIYRVYDQLIPWHKDGTKKKLTPDDTEMFVREIISEEDLQKFKEDLELDCVHSISGATRYRVNVFKQRGSYAVVLRLIPEIRTMEDLNLPNVDVIKQQLDQPNGLILVTGPTGSGKSSTLAAMIDYINSTQQKHIITAEDPVEFLHRHKQSIVNQRELGQDTKSFPEAIKHMLRETPDVILVGEMRDYETIRWVLTAAETGHLVFSTLHTNNAPETIDRIIDVFPSHQQNQVRTQLSATLRLVLAQRLLRARQTGQVPALEIMVATQAVRNSIREGRTHQLYSVIQTGGEKGMMTLEKSLATLFFKKKIARDDAMQAANDKEELVRMIGEGAKSSLNDW